MVTTRKRSLLLECFALLLCWGVASMPGSAFAELDAEAALLLARTQWFEGIPEDRIEPLTSDAVDALVALLADPLADAHHARAIEILGLADASAAVPAIVAYGKPLVSGEEEVSTSVYKARLAIPVALGRIGRAHRDAYIALLDIIDGEGPRWRTKQVDADRIARVHREICALGLAYSGRPDALEVLRRMSGAGPAEAWSRHVLEAIALHPLHQRTAPDRGSRSAGSQ